MGGKGVIGGLCVKGDDPKDLTDSMIQLSNQLIPYYICHYKLLQYICGNAE